MTGFIKYQLINYVRSLKIIPPLTVFVGWLFIFYVYKGVPILSSYAVTSIAIYLIITWITMDVFSLEEVSEKQLLFVQLRNKTRYLWGKWIVCVIFSIIMILVAITYPIIINSFKGTINPTQISLSIYSHLCLSLFGIAVGTIFSISSFISRKYSWLLAVLVIVISISSDQVVEKFGFLKWGLIIIPPVPSVIKYLGKNDLVHVSMDFWLSFLFAFIYLLAIFTIIQTIFLRKER